MMTTTKDRRRELLIHRAVLVAMVWMVAALPLVTSAPAQAEPPANDAWESATAVPSVPFRTSVDTTEATTDPVRPPGMRRRVSHSVWYHLNLESDQRLVFSTKGSDFALILSLFQAENVTDAPDLWTKIAASRSYGPKSPAGFLRELTGGVDYYVMISTYRNGPGGKAKLVVRRPARVSVALGQFATYDRIDGAAVLKGTINTNRPVTVRMEAKLRQLVDDHIVQGWARKTLEVTSKAPAWAMRVAANRPFRLGPARVPYSSLRIYDSGFYLGTLKFTRTLVTLQ